MSARRLLWLVLALAILLPVVRAVQVSTLASGSKEEVGLVYDPSALPDQQFIRDAWDSVLREEGIPFAWVSTRDLLLLDGGALARRYPALVFPDGLDQRMPTEVRDRVEEYLAAGGNVAVVYDAGVKDPSGAFRTGGLLAPLVGVQYLRYREEGSNAYLEGNVRFAGPADAAYWNIPPGKLYRGQVVGGYAYGSLTYPMADARAVAEDLRVYASYGNIPVLSVRPSGRGRALWVDLPLGYLKAYSDDLPLRSVIRTFLFDIVKVPHLVSSPGGVGGLVIDWHIDSTIEWRGIPSLLRHRLVRGDLVQEFDVTAGPFRDGPGDGLGFDACGAGERFLRELLPYGVVGSHGGWAHNWFATGLERGTFTTGEIEDLVGRNNACLQSVTGRPVRAFAAPNGVHPQPQLTRVLEGLGIRAYYYTGDTGSPPNRTFFDGAMISPRMWAFPVMPNGLQASIGEMIKAGLRPRQIGAWLADTLRYLVDQRTIRLVYSHPYDLLRPKYGAAFGRFLDRVEAVQAEGRVTVAPMEYFADFMSRFVRTESSFARDGGDLVVSLSNPAGLEDIAVAVPAELAGPAPSLPSGVTETDADGYRLFTVGSPSTALELRLPLAPA